MAAYRKKPVVIEARQFTGVDNVAEILAWVNENVEGSEPGAQGVIGGIEIATLEGPLKASVGDWIIRGVKGEFYPCKPDVFEATYEPDAGDGIRDLRVVLEDISEPEGLPEWRFIELEDQDGRGVPGFTIQKGEHPPLCEIVIPYSGRGSDA